MNETIQHDSASDEITGVFVVSPELRQRPGPADRLLTPSQIDAHAAEEPVMAETLAWMRSFLARPHPDVGRSGPVCPFVPIALAKDTIFMTTIAGEDLTADQLAEVAVHCRGLFFELPPKDGEESINKALMMIFPGIPAEQAGERVDPVQRELKPEFTRHGLMLGEFHRFNRTPGLRNPAFFPLQSPYPMLVIRHMVDTDLPFLCRDSDAPGVRLGFLKAYLRRLGGKISEQKLDLAIRALVECELEQRGLKLL